MQPKIQVSPSILAADIGCLDKEIKKVSDADWVHVDVMDGHFVPNLTWGLPVASAVRKMNLLPVDVHLMIEDPDRWAPLYAEAGCQSVTFHAEASRAPLTLARTLRELGTRAGIALRPTTSPAPYLEYLDEFDMVLVMTVEPGFGGQRFLEPTLETVANLRKNIGEGAGPDIQVDGGIDRSTITRAARAGANVFVAGSSVYGSADPAAEVAELRALAAHSFASERPYQR